MFGPTRIQPKDVAEAITALREHYPSRDLKPEALTAYLKDFVDVLAGKDAEAFRGALYAWKVDEKNKRMPTPGQLLALVKAKSPPPARSEPSPEVSNMRPRMWTPSDFPSEAELDRMPPWEAIRQHRMMAHHYRGRIGPMWVGNGGPIVGGRSSGRPAEPHELGEEWHARKAEFERKAAWHEDAAERIRAQLTEAKQRKEDARS